MALLQIVKEGIYSMYYIMANGLPRCQEDPAKCSGPNESVLEQNGGIWSDNRTENPFADYFKIFIHYCSSDDFAGAFHHH